MCLFDTLFVVVVPLPIRLEFSPPIDPTMEEELCQQLSEAGRIVSRMQQTPDSTIAALLKRLKQNLSDLEKDEVRELIKREIMTALEVGGIPGTFSRHFTMVFVNLSMTNIELLKANRNESIVLCLECRSLESLWKLKQMILSGRLLNLLSEAVKHVIQSRPRVQLIVKREDFNLCLAYFNRAEGMRKAELL